MSTSVIEPGTRIVGRYRLEDRVSQAAGSTLWKAVDETLARPIAVRTFDEDSLRVSEVVTAARAASRITDSRLAQVFDADDTSDLSYVVSEWVTGDTLVDLVAGGPMEPERAAAIVAEAAEALTAAHAAGLAHLRLRPRCLIWTSNGTVKITGLGIDAALDGVESDDPGAGDARGLGNLLYAALTGHWPGDDPGPSGCGLPPPPFYDGRPCSPHQVRAAVPQLLDSMTDRALFQESRRGQPPLTTPADLVNALAEIPRPALVPMPPPPPPPRPSSARNPAPAPPPAAHPGSPPPLAYSRPKSSPSLLTKTLVTVVILLVMAAIGVGGLQLGRVIGGGPGGNESPEAGNDPQAQVLEARGARSFDPLGDGDEKTDMASLAIDGKADTAWETEGYNSAEFGRLKSGVGLIIDMGAPVTVRSVAVDLAGHPGASFSVRVSNSPGGGDHQTLGNVSGANGTPEVRGSKTLEGRYVVLWFTKLPPDSGRHRAYVAEVVVRGKR